MNCNLIEKSELATGKVFGDFELGEGYKDTNGDVRIKIRHNEYIHVHDGVFDINKSSDWPAPVRKTQIRKYKFTIEEL